MPENTELEAFLQESAPAPVSDPPETKQQRSTGEPPPPPSAPSAAEDDDDGDDASPASTEEGSQAVVPVSALEAERRRRQDHKERAARYEGENAELRRQLEAFQRQQAPQPQYQPPPQPMPVPDPAQDPHGYQLYLQGQQINHHLNISEMLARKELGDEKVDALIADFREAMQGDPSLERKLYQQRDPYGWAAREVERIRAVREMGDDPAAWRAKVIAEERAKWEAEMGQQGAIQPATAAPASRVPNLAPSLAAARSAAPRSAPAWTGPATDEELFPPYRDRKRQA